MAKFGKYNPDGSVEREATECALTGMAVSVEDGSVREKVKGTPYFYRVHGSQYGNLTDDDRAKLAEQAKGLDAPAPAVLSVSEPRVLRGGSKIEVKE